MSQPIEIFADGLRIHLFGRAIWAPYMMEDERLVVLLDDVRLEPPHQGEELSVEELQKLSALLERYADKEGIDLEFE